VRPFVVRTAAIGGRDVVTACSEGCFRGGLAMAHCGRAESPSS